MTNITIKFDPRNVVKNFTQLANDFPKATSSAINKSAQQAFNSGKKLIREEYNIKASDLNKNTKLHKSNVNNLIAKMLGFGKSIGAFKFGGRPGKKGATVKIKRQGARKTIEHSFVAVMKSGHKGIFTRQTKKRLPIEEKFTIGVATMLRSTKIRSTIEKYFNDNFNRIFTHEIEWWKR